MNRQPFLGFLLCCLTVVYGGFLPEYNDPVHGQLVVSRRNPPFLTLKAHPGREFYLPTDQQVAEIRRAVYSRANSSQRSISNNTGFVANLRSKRRVFEEPDPDSETLTIEAFNAGMEAFTLYSVFVGQMLNQMFKDHFLKKPIDISQLTFDVNLQDKNATHFKAVLVDWKNLEWYLKDLRTTLFMKFEDHPQMPIGKVFKELHSCSSLGLREMSDASIQFENESHGLMTYYKVYCMRCSTTGTSFFFFVMKYQKFTLHNGRIGRSTNIGSYVDHELLELSSECFCCSSSMSPSKNSRTLTAAQLNELRTYLIDNVIQRIKVDFQDKIDAANGY